MHEIDFRVCPEWMNVSGTERCDLPAAVQSVAFAWIPPARPSTSFCFVRADIIMTGRRTG
jgi:hypothetical protein